MNRQDILERLRAQIAVNGHVVGAVVGSGMAAKFVAMAGIDFLLALSAGRFRIAGRSSYASYFCYGNSNQIVKEYGTSELLPIIRDVPVLFGLFASDPFIALGPFLDEIRESGFSGVVNFPTVALLDGQFREAAEEDGVTFQCEADAIAMAHERDLFTVAFVTNGSQAREMAEAGADVICAHLGLTRGGYVGDGQSIPITRAEQIAREVFTACQQVRPEVIRMVYSGPASTPVDMQYLYDNTPCQGYIGGSVFDRIPSEKAILDAAIAFKSGGNATKEARMRRLVRRSLRPSDYADVVKQHVAENYAHPIHLRDIALVLHLSYSHLSALFTREVGCTFTEYLIRYRMNIAQDLLRQSTASIGEIARSVGYRDPGQFSKTFKKRVGLPPGAFRLAEGSDWMGRS